MHLSPRLRPEPAAIVESADDAIICKDLDGIITSWNKGAQRIFGYAEVETVGRPISLLIPPDLITQEAAILARLKKGERIEHLETTGVHKNGERIDISVTVSPIRNNLGALIGASRVAHDITDRRRVEYGLHKTSEVLLRSNHDLEQFAYVASHELEEPLRAVVGCMQLLGGEFKGQQGSRAGELTRQALDGATRMQALIADLLARSRVGDNRHAVDRDTRAINILLFEDSPRDRLRVISELSTDATVNVTIESVERLADGLELLGKRSFDLALLDLDLPDSQGLSTIEQLRRQAPNLPIIVLTGRDEPELHAQALRLGARGYLVKGKLAVRMLAETIDHAVDRQAFSAARTRSITELAASEARVRAIIDANADALLIVDLHGLVRFANPAAAEMFGREVSELVGHALGFPVVTDGIAEIDVVRGDGCEGQAEMRVVQIRWDGDSAFLLSLRDVSVRKRAETALRASEAEFRVLSDAMPQIVWVMRADGWVTHFSQQWVQYTGLTLKQSLGRRWVQALHCDDRMRAWDAWRRSKIEHSIYSLECRLRRADGAYNWWLLRAVPMRDAAGGIIKWVGTCTDINDLKAAEFEITRVNGDLWRQQAELRALFNLVPAMIWFKDTENNMLRVNQRAADAAGLAVADLEGKSMFEVYPRDAAKYYADDLKVIRSGKSLLDIVEGFQDGNGNEAWIQTGKVPYRDEDGKIVGIVVMAQDVTERKREKDELRVLNAGLEDRVRARTAELNLARDEAVQANRAKTDFLAAMSHEIRTPMNGVVAMIEVLSQTTLGPPQIEMMDLIRTSAFSLLEIVDNILDLSKIEADKLSVENKPMQYCETVHTVCSMLQHVARARRVRISLFVDPQIPHTLLGDPFRLRQILVNLAGNAIKFAGGRERPGHVSVRANLIERQAAHVIIDLVVADDGIGIDAQILPTLFLPFSQADVSTTRRFGGSGLGLAISSKLAHLMNGTISVHSVLHEGSTFTVRLRFAQPDRADECVETAGLVDGLRCRIVGRDAPLGDDLEAYLAHANVIVARSPDFASAAAAERTPGLRLWLILPSPTVPVLSQLRDLARDGPDTGTRFIQLKRGIGGFPRLEAPDLVVAEAELLSQSTLIRALGLAAGRTHSASEVEGQKITSPIRVPGRDEARSQGRLILVAEDNETNREVISRQLRLIGLSAVLASDGREALNLWRSGDFGLLLTDLHMPLMDGYALATSIRAEEVTGSGRRTPIIALTANALLEEERRCLGAGMDAYLTKPVLLATLKTSIEAWLGPTRASIAMLNPMTAPGITRSPVDLDVLREMIGHDPGSIDAVLGSFRNSAALSRIELSSGGNTGVSMADVAHKLKSAARSIGAIRLGDLCAQIEPIAGLSLSGELDALMPQWQAELAAVLRFIDDRLAVGGS